MVIRDEKQGIHINFEGFKTILGKKKPFNCYDIKLARTRVEFPFTENSFNQLMSLRSSVMFLETFIMPLTIVEGDFYF